MAKMDAADRDAILAAPVEKRDEHDCLERAVVLWGRVDAKSPIRNMLRARRPDPSGRTQREKDGDPQTLQTTRAVDSLLWLLKMVQLGLIFYCWDVENQLWNDLARALKETEGKGLAAAYLSLNWESCLSKAVCKPKAPVTRVGYAVVDAKDLRWKTMRSRKTGVRFKVVVSGGTLSVSRQTAVLAPRDARLPVAIQRGPELKMGPLLGVKLLEVLAHLDQQALLAAHRRGAQGARRRTCPLQAARCAGPSRRRTPRRRRRPYKLVLILTRHTLARAGLANRLLDRHEVVTIDGDVVTLRQATP